MTVTVKNRQQLLTIVAVAVVTLFAADKLLLTPLANWWNSRSKSIAALRKQVQDGNQLVRREQSLRARWEDMRANTLPNNPSAAEQQVLKAVDRWAQDSRIVTTSISDQWKHDADDYSTLQCRVEASGNLNTIVKFLYDIEKDPMALKLDTVEISSSSHDSEGQQLSLGLQISGLTLTGESRRE